MSKVLVKAKHPEIQLSAPWADDVFERQIVGERLARLIANTPDNFVLALKAPFGSGKSVFLDRLSKHIESSANSMPVVSLNAWENDHHIDPMEALLVALSDRVQQIKSQSIRSTAVALLNNAIKYAVPVMKVGARVALAVKSFGLSEAAIAAAEDLAAVDTSAVDTGLQLLEDARKRKSDREMFCHQLHEVRSKLLSDCNQNDGKLVFVIDELDRCRPDFAIKMLERIKHFFNEPGIAFVLALDNDNLNSAVQTLYGPHADGERYLRKFFDMEFFLPPATPEKVIMNLMMEHGHIRIGGVQELEEGMKRVRASVNPNDHYDSPAIPYFAVALTDFSVAYDLSIRDLTQIMTALTAVVRSCPVSQPLVPFALCLGLVCRFVDPKGFTSVIAGQTGLSKWYGDFHNDAQRISDTSFTAKYVSAYRVLGRVKHVDFAIKMHEHNWIETGTDAHRVGVRARIQNDFHAALSFFSGDRTLDQYVCELLKIGGQVVPPAHEN